MFLGEIECKQTKQLKIGTHLVPIFCVFLEKVLRRIVQGPHKIWTNHSIHPYLTWKWALLYDYIRYTTIYYFLAFLKKSCVEWCDI